MLILIIAVCWIVALPALVVGGLYLRSTAPGHRAPRSAEVIDTALRARAFIGLRGESERSASVTDRAA